MLLWGPGGRLLAAKRRIRIPGSQSRIEWPIRVRGVVRVIARLPISRDAKSPPSWLRLELTFRREHLSRLLSKTTWAAPTEHLSNLADQSVFALEAFAVPLQLATKRRQVAGPSIPPSRQLPGPRIARAMYRPPWFPGHRRSILVMPVHYGGRRDRRSPRRAGREGHTGFRYQLKVERADLAARVSFLPPRALRLLRLEARLSLWPHEFVQWTLKRRARGPKAQASRLLQVARVALFVAEELVARAERHRLLQSRIYAAIQDEHLPPLLTREVAIILADRSLRPAWRKYGVVPLVDRDEYQLFNKLLRPSARRALAEGLTTAPNRQSILTAWIDRLLGPEGQAARDFALL